jgi:hypothetical protein
LALKVKHWDYALKEKEPESAFRFAKKIADKQGNGNGIL